MARAFTEKEKKEIREKILETALDLFHDEGTKSLNIGELTKRVGIAQGSFYNFWKNKDSLIVDLLAYRSMQKLKILEKDFSKSLDKPTEFLTNTIYSSAIYLLEKTKIQPIYREAFKIFAHQDTDKTNKVEKLYIDFVNKLVDYWQENHVIRNVNRKGLSNAFIGSFILCAHYSHFDEDSFEDVLHTYISSIVNKYIEL